MWHPLKNSLYSLSLVTVALIALLALGEPVANATAHSAEADSNEIMLTEHGFVQSIDALSVHLPIDDAAEKALAIAAVRLAARVIQAEVNIRSETAAKAAQRTPPRARRQSTMPFFSFANLLPRSKEPGA